MLRKQTSYYYVPFYKYNTLLHTPKQRAASYVLRFGRPFVRLYGGSARTPLTVCARTIEYFIIIIIIIIEADDDDVGHQPRTGSYININRPISLAAHDTSEKIDVRDTVRPEILYAQNARPHDLRRASYSKIPVRTYNNTSRCTEQELE